MFKTATVFSALLPTLDASLFEANKFTPTLSTQELSIGWECPSRSDHYGELFAIVGYDVFMRARIETRSVPGPVLKREVEKQAASIERETGRKPGRKERKELAETVRLELLPKAFPKQTDVQVAWLSEPRLLVVESSSAVAVEAVADLVSKTIPGATLGHAATHVSPRVAMTAALAVEGGTHAVGHHVGSACVLKTPEGRAVSYKMCYLNRPEIRTQIAEGFMVERLALEGDSLSFELDHGLVLHKLEIFDDLLNAQTDGTFDGSATIFAGVFSSAWSDLVAELGGTA